MTSKRPDEDVSSSLVKNGARKNETFETAHEPL